MWKMLGVPQCSKTQGVKILTLSRGMVKRAGGLLQCNLMRRGNFSVERLHACLPGGCTLLPAFHIFPQDVQLLASAPHLPQHITC